MRLFEWLTGAVAALSVFAGAAVAQEAPATTLSDDLQAGRLRFDDFLPRAGRIVGGHPARVGEDPWQVALFRSDLWGSVLCGGSVVQPGWIVTAAHCVTPAPSLPRLTVVAGFTHIHPLPRGAYLTVDKIVLHPLWDPQLDAQGRVHRFSNDVALIHVPALDRIEPDRRIAAINLASEETMSALSTGVDLRVTGWGALWYGGRQTWALQAVTVPLADFSTCQQRYGAGLDETMICAGFDAGGRDACQGDSGGPLTAQVNGEAVLVGIVSFGEGCGAPQSYGVYARASRVRDWIADCLAAHAAAARRDWADLRCTAPSDSPDETHAP